MLATNTPKNIKKILIVRNDKLGDLLVSFSAFAILKKNLPDTEIHVLVSQYTAPMAKLCEFIDHVMIDPLPQAGKIHYYKETKILARQFRQQNYDAVISLFSTTRVAVAALLAKIPIRIAPATKIAQIFYNQRVIQRRSRSEKPEHRYNQELAEHLLSLLNIVPLQTVKAPFLRFKPDTIANIKQQFLEKHHINKQHTLIFIHPGSGGSARNLSALQFAQLANNLQSSTPFSIIVSYGPGEKHIAEAVYAGINQHKVLYESKQGLEKFSQHLAFADIFISGSTGPLHIAGVLDRPTAAFYTRRRSATALRWQTLNSENKRLAFYPAKNTAAEDMSAINIEQAAEKISQQFL